ncbi:MAG: YicC family protein [Spirochaetaceae bacterium]|nr:YicC family protein [Spirochaetaceae bacterium]
MTSMTGFSYVEDVGENYTVSVEIKSYNSRYLDLTINMPSFLSRLENTLRELVVSKVLRGKVEIYIRLKEENQNTNVAVNIEAAKAYAKALEQILEILGRGTEEIPLSLIVQQEGVLVSSHQYDMEYYKQIILPVFEKSLNDFIADRNREGENLFYDLSEKIQELENAMLFFKNWQPKMEMQFRENLTNRFQEILGEDYDQQRVLTEIAAMLVKYTINEEVVRLESHICALREEISNNPAPGKKIDFLCQEINREINTIGSKNQFAQVSEMVINAKNALENIREQAKNVE